VLQAQNLGDKTVSSGKRLGIVFISLLLCLFAPSRLAAQEQGPDETTSHSLWSSLKDGTVDFNVRYRFEAFELDGAAYTAPAYAPTLRLALGYETRPFHGFSLFAQSEAVLVTGPADYNDPTLASQIRPNRPVILDPRSFEVNQGYVNWTHSVREKKLNVRVGRQEMSLNDGRFLSTSLWRQVHGSFEAAHVETELPRNFSFTYAFINRAYRVVGYDASDGQPRMHTHMANLAWSKTNRINASLYALLLDYRSLAEYSLSTQTYGLRLTGPYQFNKDWSVVYTAEFAKQLNYGTNPYKVNAHYYLGELGPGWRSFAFKAGYALLSGRSPTDKLTTPLAPPFNGWSDLFFFDPSGGGGNGLNARYLLATGPLHFLGDSLGTLIYYDYHSDYPRVHYGSELDAALAYKVRRVSDHWEIGWRFARYWADRLFSNGVRTSIYTSFTL
jgi:hypothetical protein